MKKKRVLKSKEELIADLQSNQKWAAKMKFAKEEFYPALLDLDSSIDDTKMFITSLNGMMMEKFLGFMKEKKFADLGLVKILDTKDKRYEGYVKLLSLFNDMSVYDAKDLIEGMKSEIDTFLTDEMKERKLSTLKPKWLDELAKK